jgi:putative transposase
MEAKRKHIRSPEQMVAEIRRLQKENEYLKRQREILKKIDEHLGGEIESRYAMIKELSVDFEVKACCQALRVSRSGYYQWQKAEPGWREKENAKLLEQIKKVFAANKSRYGSPRITRELRQQGLKCGKNRIARLMRENKLSARDKKVP